MNDPYVTWIVPCRRAVVKQTINYRTLVESWQDCLWHYNEKLIGWYNMEGYECLQGLVRVANWIGTLPPRRLSVRREGENPVDSRPPYFVRLWKGPLRVLLEHEAGVAGQPRDVEVTIGTQTKTLSETRIQHSDETLILRIDPEHKDVWNTNARFLMGDVVEFPVAKFLVAAGKTEYDGITFNPAGSFFCGTSLLQGDDVRTVEAEPKVHENLIAMRFQLLLNLMRGAFYSRQTLFASGTSRTPSAQEPDGGESLHARGMIYGNSFGNPARDIDESEPDYWVVGTNNWGCVSPGGTESYAAHLPSRNGRQSLKLPGRDLPLTPAIACSPSSLFLTRYILNLFCPAQESIHTTLQREERRRRSAGRRRTDPGNPLYGKFEAISLSEFSGDEADDQLENNEELRERIDRILRRLGCNLRGVGSRRSQPPFSRECLSNERTSSLSGSMRSQLRSSTNRNYPGRAMETVNSFLGDASLEEEQRRHLNEIHRCLHNGFAEIRTQLEQILEDETWDRLSISRPDIRPTRLPSGQHAEQPCVESHEISHDFIQEICQSLRSSRRPLRGREGVWRVDVSDILADVNVIDRPAHELSVVKVYPFERIMTRDTLPLSDRMAAYDPLSGEPFCEEIQEEEQPESPAEASPSSPPEEPEGEQPPAEEAPEEDAEEPEEAQQDRSLADVGQLFYFEASDALFKWVAPPSGGRKQCCGVSPFKWEKIENNVLYFKREGRKLHASTSPGGDGTIDRAYKAINTTLRQRYPDSEEGSLATDGAGDTPQNVWAKPIAILGLSGSDAEWSGRSGTLGPHTILMADRAVPFPTMQEVDTCYPRISVTPPQAQSAHDAADAAVTPFLPGGGQHADTLSHLDDMGRETLLTTSVPAAHHTRPGGSPDPNVQRYHNNAHVVKDFCATLHGELAGGNPRVSNQQQTQFRMVWGLLRSYGGTWFGAARAEPVRDLMASLLPAIDALQGIPYKNAVARDPSGEPAPLGSPGGGGAGTS